MKELNKSSAFGNAETEEDKYKNFTREELIKEINKGLCKITNIQASSIENPFDIGSVDIVSTGYLYINTFFKGKSLYEIMDTPIEVLKQVLSEKDNSNSSTYAIGPLGKDELAFTVNLLCPKEISCDLENTICILKEGVIEGENGKPVYKTLVVLQNGKSKVLRPSDYDLLLSRIEVLKEDNKKFNNSKEMLESEILKFLHNIFIINGYVYLDDIKFTSTGKKFTSANLYVHKLLPIDKILDKNISIYKKIELSKKALLSTSKAFVSLKNLTSKELATYMLMLGSHVLIKGTKSYGVADTKVIIRKDNPKVSTSFSVINGHLELEGLDHKRKDI
ncbi:hypothetical protein D3C81_1100050 [compost metagenome]